MSHTYTKTQTLGEIAFEAYNDERGGRNYRGEQTPDWEELPEGIRQAWEKAALAVKAALED